MKLFKVPRSWHAIKSCCLTSVCAAARLYDIAWHLVGIQYTVASSYDVRRTANKTCLLLNKVQYFHTSTPVSEV